VLRADAERVTGALPYGVNIDEFAALCRDGAARAARRAHPVLVSWTVPVPAHRITDAVRLLPGAPGRTFCWLSTWSGFRRLAIGTALDVTGHGAARFDQLSGWLETSGDGALLGGSGRMPTLVGGFRFGTEGIRPQGVPDALMWLPAAELTETDEMSAELTLNAWVHPAVHVERAVITAATAARALLQPPPPPETVRPQLRSLVEEPSACGWQQLVRSALDAISNGVFEKVLLARRVEATFDRPVSVSGVLSALIEGLRAGAVFGVQLGGRWFVGRTPECLVHTDGERAAAHTLAGSVPRDEEPAHDENPSGSVRTSPRTERRRAIIADFAAEVLGGFFTEVTVSPVVDIAQRDTQITATGPKAPINPLRLAEALHPTPAVGGFPRDPAVRWLADNEPGDRGWYASPIGWAGPHSGEFALGVRSADIAGTSATLYAGCGIVAGSDPAEEYAETCAKMRQMLEVLGIDDDGVAA